MTENFFRAAVFVSLAAFGLAAAELALPEWARLAGTALAGISLALLLWVHAALGRNWSAYVEIAVNHRLIQEGPEYRRYMARTGRILPRIRGRLVS